MSKLDEILKDHSSATAYIERYGGSGRSDKEGKAAEEEADAEAKQQIKDLMLELIGEDNEHYKDMPVPDPDPFLLPQDHQNQLRRYLRQKVEEL